MQHTTNWTITNNQGLDIIGNTDHPTTNPHATLILLHGFKGYKDYGFIPILSHALANHGILTHRFNFSTSGMTNNTETFARPDLFALDTWNRQVEDVHCVINAIINKTLPGANLPLFLCGHSRGGGTALLTAARTPQPNLAGLITINSVDACNRMDTESQNAILQTGHTITQSARTKQDLRINATWLQEQLDDPASHNILSLCKDITCPTLTIHGNDDQAVPIEAGINITNALDTTLHTISGANHVLNTANPAPINTHPSPQLGEVIKLLQSFVDTNSTKTPI